MSIQGAKRASIVVGVHASGESGLITASCGRCNTSSILSKPRERSLRDFRLWTLSDKGVYPGELRKSGKQARIAAVTDSFEAVAREWHAKFSPDWSATHANKLIRRLEKRRFNRFAHFHALGVNLHRRESSNQLGFHPFIAAF